MLKEQKGITLVALIITIIVMLILAGVSISLVVGENGVLTQAQSVEPKQVEGALREAVSMASADIVATYYSNSAGEAEASDPDNIDDFIVANFESYASDYDVTLSAIAGDGSATVTATEKNAAGTPITATVNITAKAHSKGYYQLKVID